VEEVQDIWEEVIREIPSFRLEANIQESSETLQCQAHKWVEVLELEAIIYLILLVWETGLCLEATVET
jgi:hypothetical protein